MYSYMRTKLEMVNVEGRMILKEEKRIALL